MEQKKQITEYKMQNRMMYYLRIHMRMVTSMVTSIQKTQKKYNLIQNSEAQSTLMGRK